MSNTQIISRRLKLSVVGDKEEKDRVYTYLRDAIYNQNKAYNILISNVYSAIYSGKSKEEISDIYKRGQRKPKENDNGYSLYKYGEIVFPVGMMVQASVGQMVKNDIQKAKSNGLFIGKSSLPNRRLDAALRIENQQFSFFYDYNSYQEFLDKLLSKDVDIYMKFVNGITFKVILGNPHKSVEIRSVFKNIFENNYCVKGSSININGTEIFLNLSLEIPKQEKELDENIIVGVDLGLAIPAMCALNTSDYIQLSIGSRDDFLRVRTQIKNQRRRLYSNLKFANGGHGRKKKMQAADRFTDYEKNWVKTYNHMVSKRVVDFALKHKAKYINLECLDGISQNDLRNNYLLANWSYYQLQQYIKYKAEKYGIVVRFVNPYHTSQNCSCCGHWEEGQRVKQAEFICKNPKCKNFGKKVNADFNAARNIAMSTDFVDKSEKKTKKAA